MPYVFVISVIIFSIIVIRVLYIKNESDKKTMSIIKSNTNILKDIILHTTYKHYKYHGDENYEGFAKISLLEKMNLKPSILKSCLQQLIREGIITENNDKIKMTDFGKQFYENTKKKG